VPPFTTIPNRGAMTDFVAPFEVLSRLTGERYAVRFSHLWNGIATRHSDTVDARFFVNGRSVLVGLAHRGFGQFHESMGRSLTDREAAFIAARYLRERLEQEDERPLYDVPAADVVRLARSIGLS
jgi:hypothetical protein